MRKILILVVLAMFPASAGAAVITFDSLPAGPLAGGLYSEAGFDITWFDPGTGASDGFIGAPGTCALCADNGTAFAIGGPNDPEGLLSSIITITKSGGGLFTFHGFDAAEVVAFGGTTNALLEVTDGGSYLDLFTLDTILDGSGPLADFQTFAPTGGPVGVTSLSFSASIVWDYGIDNIVLDDVAPVPEPASLLLFGTGLTALAYRARRRRRS